MVLPLLVKGDPAWQHGGDAHIFFKNLFGLLPKRLAWTAACKAAAASATDLSVDNLNSIDFLSWFRSSHQRRLREE
jgi:hypothetical protein